MSTESDRDFVAVVLVNYRNYSDTLRCVDSLLACGYEDLAIYVVDNNSLDDSSACLAEGLEVRGARGRKLSFIQSEENGGFSKGNNLGIRRALAEGADYIWLLNNDTLVDPGCVQAYKEYWQRREMAGERVGPIGAKIVNYLEPSIIQGIGGVFNAVTGSIRHVGAGDVDSMEFDARSDGVSIDYPLGVSMFVSAKFIADVGVLSEDYFLYFEELDWSIRAREGGWKVGYCPAVRVRHKEGASIGSSTVGAGRSELSDVVGMKSRFTLMRKHYPFLLPLTFVSLVFVIFNRIRRGQLNRVPKMLRAAWLGATLQ